MKHRALVLLVTVLSACAPAAEAPAPQAPPPPMPTAEPQAAPSVLPDATPEAAATGSAAGEAPSPAPAPLLLDIASAPPPALETAAQLVQKGSFGRARREIAASLPRIQQDGALEVILTAHALQGRACVKLKDSRCADIAFETVLKLWANPADAIAKLDARGGDDLEKRRRTGRALLAVGEARYHEAEKKRAAADKIARPSYHGSGVRDDVLAFVNKEIAGWVKAKRPAIEDAEKAYTRVLEIQPVPPPVWIVASAARVGGMWSDFVDAFRSTPMPKEWQGNGSVPGAPGLTYEELRTEYQAKISEASAPQLERARAAFKKGSEIAARYQIDDEHSRACAAWLSAQPKSP